MFRCGFDSYKILWDFYIDHTYQNLLILCIHTSFSSHVNGVLISRVVYKQEL